jgi:hypothetical protein
MIEITVHDGYYLITAPKCMLVLTKAEFIQALQRGKWWRRTEAMRARLTRPPCSTPPIESSAGVEDSRIAT